MIDHENHIAYVDNSTLATFRACKEKANLRYVKKRVRPDKQASLGFGHAWHAGAAAFYDAKAGGYHDPIGNWHAFNSADHAVSPTIRAKAAFLRDLGHTGVELPVGLESEERRSIERGLALLEAYIARYRNEPYENILVDGRPLVEIGFKFDLCDWRREPTYKIVYVGFIDRVMLNSYTQRPVNFELKTTTQALSQYIQQCKPNHQITGYTKAINLMFPDLGITDTVWDCVFVSSRNADMGKAIKDRFWMYGVDIEKDFKRQTTSRSQTDLEAWWSDTVIDAREYMDWVMSGWGRWPRDTGSCHSYGGCDYRNVCAMNGNQEYLETNFVLEEWNPAERIRQGRR